jgi:outer membrane protein
MKKTLLIALVLVCTAFSTQAQQRYAIIDTKYILERIPEYRDADKKLQQVGEQWQKEIDDKQTQLDKMYKNYEAEQFMLTEELRKKREDELFVREKEIRDLQKKRFGYEGDLFKERQRLIKPVQDRVYNATGYTMPFRKWHWPVLMTSYSIKVKELPLYLPTPSWIKAMIS